MNLLLMMILIIGQNNIVECLISKAGDICYGEEWSCQNKCGLEHITPCSCSASCKKYQICCEDYEEICEENSVVNGTLVHNGVRKRIMFPITTASTNISEDPVTGWNTDSNGVTGAHIISENSEVTVTSGMASDTTVSNSDGIRRGYCSDILNIWLEEGCSNIRDVINYERCLRPNNTFIDDITPVTNIQTNTRYKNIYCALCNNDSNTVSWLETGNCTKITDSHHYYNHCLSQMKDPVNEQPMLCIPKSISDFNKTAALDLGYTETDIEEYARKCKEFTSYVVDENETVFKNRYCYLLNKINSNCNPPVFNQQDIYCAKHRHNLDKCMKDICSKNDQQAIYKYCSNETFRLSFSIVFNKGDTSDLDIIQDESGLVFKGSDIITTGITEAYKFDVNTSLSCDLHAKREIWEGDKVTFWPVLNCNIAGKENETIMTSDILNIVFDGVRSVDNQVKIPLNIHITACISRTSSFRQKSFVCNSVQFDIKVIQVPKVTPLDFEGYLTIICCVLSDAGLIFRIALQFTVPYFQTLPGKVQFCLCCTLFVAYTSFLVGGFVEIGSLVCYIAAVVTHWSLLSSLFWMNVIAFQIWRTFRVWHNQVSDRRLRTLIASSVYAMGIPTIFVATALFIEFLYPKNSFSPLYGKYSCWMNKSYSVLTWFVIPCCTISLVNTFFALLTVRGLRVQRMKDEASSSNKIGPVNDFVVSVRIVILVGVTWILGLFAAFLGSAVTWLMFTIFNASLGFLISLVLLCNKRVFGLLKNKCLFSVKTQLTSITVNNTSRQS